MQQPYTLLGIILGIVIGGIIAGLFVYKLKKKWWVGVVGAIISFLAIATPLHGFVIAIASGIGVNKLLYKYVEKNWLAFLISVPGFFLMVLIFSTTFEIYLPTKATGSMGLGEGLGRGIGMGILAGLYVIASSIFYLFTSAGTSFYRWAKRKKK